MFVNGRKNNQHPEINKIGSQSVLKLKFGFYDMKTEYLYYICTYVYILSQLAKNYYLYVPKGIFRCVY
jgi:hypothetical protein